MATNLMTSSITLQAYMQGGEFKKIWMNFIWKTSTLTSLPFRSFPTRNQPQLKWECVLLYTINRLDAHRDGMCTQRTNMTTFFFENLAYRPTPTLLPFLPSKILTDKNYQLNKIMLVTIATHSLTGTALHRATE